MLLHRVAAPTSPLKRPHGTSTTPHTTPHHTSPYHTVPHQALSITQQILQIAAAKGIWQGPKIILPWAHCIIHVTGDSRCSSSTSVLPTHNTPHSTPTTPCHSYPNAPDKDSHSHLTCPPLISGWIHESSLAPYATWFQQRVPFLMHPQGECTTHSQAVTLCCRNVPYTHAQAVRAPIHRQAQRPAEVSWFVHKQTFTNRP